MLDIAKIQAMEDIKEIRMRLDRLEKFLNERNSVYEGEKVCEHEWIFDEELGDSYCKQCKKFTGLD